MWWVGGRGGKGAGQRGKKEIAWLVHVRVAVVVLSLSYNNGMGIKNGHVLI